MSKWAKILWLVCGLSLALLVTTRYILGGWTTDILFIPLVLFLISAVLALVVDYKFYIEFLTLRTTKHGMNMGAMIFLVLTLLVSVNYFGMRFSKSVDLTAEKLHSLADQSTKVIDGLKQDLNVVGFYRGAKDNEVKSNTKRALDTYTNYSSKIKVRFVDAYVENELSNQYLKGQAEIDKLVLFTEYNGRRVRVMDPFTEQNVTSAIIKATRNEQKTLYFLKGHGERDINSDEQQGLAEFKRRLEDSSYIVKEFTLMLSERVPDDADVVAIIGPKIQLIEGERKALIDYAKKGGRLLVAADPGEKHNIAKLAKEFGVEFKNNYILDLGLNRLLGRGAAGILGLNFDPSNDITKKFVGRQQGYTVFDLVQEVRASSDSPEGINLTEIVKSSPSSFVVDELRNVTPPQKRDTYSMVVLAEGEFKQKDEKQEGTKGEKFAAVFFGDSDFVAQKDIQIGLNIDMALNTVAYLAKQADLISIKPKAPKGTELVLTATKSNIMVVCGILIPFVFVILSGVMWYRRRNA